MGVKRVACNSYSMMGLWLRRVVVAGGYWPWMMKVEEFLQVTRIRL